MPAPTCRKLQALDLSIALGIFDFFHLNIDHAWILGQDVAGCKSHLWIAVGQVVVIDLANGDQAMTPPSPMSI